ncbi:hypothetical protein OG21DRAFT_1507157 [Imleria badia]|nr:hypothetical protein OG21DRAFT_1507157 [Imleria badia]
MPSSPSPPPPLRGRPCDDHAMMADKGDTHSQSPSSNARHEETTTQQQWMRATHARTCNLPCPMHDAMLTTHPSHTHPLVLTHLSRGQQHNNN